MKELAKQLEEFEKMWGEIKYFTVHRGAGGNYPYPVYPNYLEKVRKFKEKMKCYQTEHIFMNDGFKYHILKKEERTKSVAGKRAGLESGGKNVIKKQNRDILPLDTDASVFDSSYEAAVLYIHSQHQSLFPDWEGRRILGPSRVIPQLRLPVSIDPENHPVMESMDYYEPTDLEAIIYEDYPQSDFKFRMFTDEYTIFDDISKGLNIIIEYCVKALDLTGVTSILVVVGIAYGLYISVYLSGYLHKFVIGFIGFLMRKVFFLEKLVSFLGIVLPKMIDFGRNYARLSYYTNREYLSNVIPFGSAFSNKKSHGGANVGKIILTRRKILRPSYYYSVFKAPKVNYATITDELNQAEYYCNRRRIKEDGKIPVGLHLNWFYYDYYAYKNRNNYKGAFRYDYMTPIISNVSEIVNRRMVPPQINWNMDGERSRLNFFDLPSGVLREPEETKGYSLFSSGGKLVKILYETEMRLKASALLNFGLGYGFLYVSSIGGNGGMMPLFTCFFLAALLHRNNMEYLARVEKQKRLSEEEVKQKKIISGLEGKQKQSRERIREQRAWVRRRRKGLLYDYRHDLYKSLSSLIRKKEKGFIFSKMELLRIRIKGFIWGILNYGVKKELGLDVDKMLEENPEKVLEERVSLLMKILSFSILIITPIFLIKNYSFILTVRDAVERKREALLDYMLTIRDFLILEIEILKPLAFLSNIVKDLITEIYINYIRIYISLDGDFISISFILYEYLNKYLSKSEMEKYLGIGEVKWNVVSNKVISIINSSGEIGDLSRLTISKGGVEPNVVSYQLPKVAHVIVPKRMEQWLNLKVEGNKAYSMIYDAILSMYLKVTNMYLIMWDIITLFPGRGFYIASFISVLFIGLTLSKCKNILKSVIESDNILKRNRILIKRLFLKRKWGRNIQFQSKGIGNSYITFISSTRERKLYLLYNKYGDKIRMKIREMRKG